MLLLFVYVLGGAISVGGGAYVNYLLPGILLITVASGIAYNAFRLFSDVSSGIFERFQSMPITRSAVLWSHVVTSVVANLTSVVLVVLLAVAMGFPLRHRGSRLDRRLGPRAAVHPRADLAGGHPRAHGHLDRRGQRVLLPLIFLPFISSAFVPTGGMPGPVRWFADHQPVTSVVNTVRDLCAQQPLRNEG